MSITLPILNSILTDYYIELKKENLNLNNELVKIKNDNIRLKTELKTLNNKLNNLEFSCRKLEKIDIIHKLYNKMYRSHIELINEFHTKNLPKDIIINKFIELDNTIEKMNNTSKKKNYQV